MNNKKLKRIVSVVIICLTVLMFLLLIIFISGGIYEQHCKNRSFAECAEKTNAVENACIRIVHEQCSDNVSTYSIIAGGVIFEKSDDLYYALTAWHAVHHNAGDRYYVSTMLTPSRKEFYASEHSGGYYENLPEASIIYENEAYDLAVISFSFSDELDTVVISPDIIEKGEKIAVILSAENRKNGCTKHFGEVLSDRLKSFTADDNQSTNMVLWHNAYIGPGFSGCGVFDEEMRLIGINIGGTSDIFGHFRHGVFIPNNQIIQCINTWKTICTTQ